jgi:small subunit ribosomal protein S21
VQEVSKKEKESFDNLLRRFNKKVQQSGVLSVAKRKQYFERPLSKREQRISAIRKRARKDAKMRNMFQ